MNTCDTCKWWGRPHKEVRHKRECDHPKVDHIDVLCDDGALLDDSESSLMATFYSGPKFGCVHHLFKEDLRNTGTQGAMEAVVVSSGESHGS